MNPVSRAEVFVYGFERLLSRNDVRNFKEILKSLLRRPLQKPRGDAPQQGLGQELSPALRARGRLTLPRPSVAQPRIYDPIEDGRTIQDAFWQLRDLLYQLNQAAREESWQAAPLLWESGKLAGMRAYFYLQPWNERGLLFEAIPRGWIVTSAEKITSQSQFMRDLTPWDRVTLYCDQDDPKQLRYESLRMGEGLVSPLLYENFMSQLLQDMLSRARESMRKP